ncbi:MAG: 3,4-dihydroxy-2-butanone-4-phosphate synthase [Actinobacteria bacterium]|nr:3,4-dihydroxy-2-butanone-4-phosphate synthase [Actinomycetota bacterium]
MERTMKNMAEAVEIFAQGKFLIVIDDENRENEGDLIISGEKITDQDMAFLIRHTSGIICSAISAKRAKDLSLPIMVKENEDSRRTAFTISIDAKAGLTTGISATERASTVRQLAAKDSKAADFIRPGHVFPLIAHPAGLAGRGGHTEAGLALCQLANQGESGVLSELVNDDGTVMKGKQLFDFAAEFKIPVITIEDLTKYAFANLPIDSTSSEDIQWAQLPHESGTWQIATIKGEAGIDHAVLRFAGDGTKSDDSPILIRAHSECLTGDAFGSLRCDCGEQLKSSFNLIAEKGAGYIIYLRGQEGRGIGLGEKIKAYLLQDAGADTIAANLELGHENDTRDWRDLISILDQLEIKDVELITNNQAKVDAIVMSGRNVQVRAVAPAVNQFNRSYLLTKKDKMKHTLGEI